MTVKAVSVKTGGGGYDIIIGESVLSEISRMDRLLSTEKCAVIISSRVHKLHSGYIAEILKKYPKCEFLLMKDGEKNKNIRYAGKFLDRLLESGCSRKSAIIGIGGGVTGDFAGFIAALFMRGITLIHVPTTLLAMVDSSIGGKTAVNISSGKNIAGVFHQPGLVVSDMNFLSTLPDSEIGNGLTEVLKHGMIGEGSLLQMLLRNDLNSIRKPEILAEMVYLSARFKSSVVESDEKEGGLRAILNFGHTAGHAIESLMKYRGISHGEAVAIGIKIEMEISRRLGWINDDDSDMIKNIINKYKLVRGRYALKPYDIIRHMGYDKKNTGGIIKFALLKGMGNPVFNQTVEDSLIREIIEEV